MAEGQSAEAAAPAPAAAPVAPPTSLPVSLPVSAPAAASSTDLDLFGGQSGYKDPSSDSQRVA